MNKKMKCLIAAGSISALIIGYAIGSYQKYLLSFFPGTSSELAAWVGALGSIGAVFSAIWIMDRQRLHTEKKDAEERREKMRMCLTVTSYTVGGIITSLDLLESKPETDLAWTVTNQIQMVSMMLGPTLCIPIHELKSHESIQCVFLVRNLAQRLINCLEMWNKCAINGLDYVLDLRQTVATLKPEANDLFEITRKIFAELSVKI